MALNTATFTWTLTERAKLRRELAAYFQQNPGAKLPADVERRYKEETREYLSASPEERREDFTGRPNKINILADSIMGGGLKNDPVAQQIVSGLPDLGLEVGQEMKESYYHGPNSFIGKLGQSLGMIGFGGAFGAAAGAATGSLLGTAAAQSYLPLVAEIGASQLATRLLPSDKPPVIESQENAPKTDEDLRVIEDTLIDILTNAGKPGDGPKILQDQPASVFSPPEVPKIEDIETQRTETSDPTPDDQNGNDKIFIPPIAGGVFSDPTQPPAGDPDLGEGEKDNSLAAMLAILGAGGLLGSTITKNEVDRDFKPNIPRVNSQGNPVYSDFDIAINEPRLSLEKFRGKRLALPEFMT